MIRNDKIKHPDKRQHCTPPTNVPTPTHLDPQQSLTPSYILKLCYFQWLIAAQVSIIEYPLYTIVNYEQVWALCYVMLCCVMLCYSLFSLELLSLAVKAAVNTLLLMSF